MIRSVDIQPSFGEWVRQTREGRGIKQNELSQLIAHLGKGYSYDQSHISRIENGAAAATHEFCVAFALVVGLPINAVLYHAGLVGEDALREAETDMPTQEFQHRLKQFDDPGQRAAAARAALAVLDSLAKEEKKAKRRK